MTWIGVWSLFFVVPLIELGLLILLAHWIGWLPTILLTLASSVVGAELARRSGRRWWAEVRAMYSGGPIDLGHISEGVLILLAAVMVLTPGPLTGLFGLALLMPGVRRTVRRALFALIRRRFWF